MLSLPVLSALGQAFHRFVANVESRFKNWTRPASYALLEATAADLIRTKPELIAENAFLRQQLIVLKRQVKHPTFTPFDRGLLVVLASRISHWKQALLAIKPETLLKWYRQGFKLFWRHKSQGQALCWPLWTSVLILTKNSKSWHRAGTCMRRWSHQSSVNIQRAISSLQLQSAPKAGRRNPRE
jgi:hypothetical protein